MLSFSAKTLLSATTTHRFLSMTTSSSGPMERSIYKKITDLFHPNQLTITNDSWQHRHHAAMKERSVSNGETHFSIEIVSESFSGKTTMQRHRMIYGALSEEFAQGLHALSLKTRVASEAQQTRVASAQD